MPRSAELRIRLPPFSEPPRRCYISTGGNLPPVFVNSIFHVFTYLYSSRVRARARAPCRPGFCVFLRTFLQIFVCFLPV